MLSSDLFAVAFYSVSMFALWGYAAILMLAWVYRREPMVGALSMYFLWTGVDSLSRVLLRSPYALVPDDAAFWVGRLAVAMMIVFGWLVVDAYLASTNAHLSLLRRIWYWWDRRNEIKALHDR
jgi:hypothetical protein